MNKDKILQGGKLMKTANVETLEITDSVMAKINKLALEPLEADDVYVFKAAMCDNEIDRQHERFKTSSLKQIAKAYIGKTLIKDHQRTTNNQVGRVYDAEVVTDAGKQTSLGEPYTAAVAHCYILKTDSNKDLIQEIRGGIKKEVSVNVSVGKMECSICQKDNMKDVCEHWWGREYDGEKCHFILDKPNDAYELSFVAVPAQVEAGAIKQDGAPETEQSAKKVAKQENGEKELTVKLKAFDAFIYIQKEKHKEETE